MFEAVAALSKGGLPRCSRGCSSLFRRGRAAVRLRRVVRGPEETFQLPRQLTDDAAAPRASLQLFVVRGVRRPSRNHATEGWLSFRVPAVRWLRRAQRPRPATTQRGWHWIGCQWDPVSASARLASSGSPQSRAKSAP